ncbi:cupin domain-containing protein [Mycolicibacterium hodleri]|uniref:Cupin domain-containing protein n=1 Tax=Mycolicibacterium hodleri TaxID=49897 RepID=A0A502E5T0_9MYCO|nr:cupin domain-containing protein [Mycolicibacterium hodleri]TPG31916.1 cupin domain-containing protein [Mycolicibacterium hodleri]
MNAVRRLVPSAVAAILVSTVSVATASATPNVGLQAETLSQATVDGHDYVTKEITIAPGGSTGWHWHPGRVFGVIRAGTLTHDVADCSVDGVYPAGSPITEASGADNVHIGRNLGPDPVVLWVIYIDLAGDPLSVDVPNPGCPFE